MDLSLAGVKLHVTDVEQSLAFYQRLPGAEVIVHIPNRFALLRFGGARLGLLNNRSRQFHFEFECTELDSTYERFHNSGYQLRGHPQYEPGTTNEISCWWILMATWSSADSVGRVNQRKADSS